MITIEDINAISANNKGTNMLEASQKLVEHVNYVERLNLEEKQKEEKTQEIE